MPYDLEIMTSSTRHSYDDLPHFRFTSRNRPGTNYALHERLARVHYTYTSLHSLRYVVNVLHPRGFGAEMYVYIATQRRTEYSLQLGPCSRQNHQGDFTVKATAHSNFTVDRTPTTLNSTASP